MEDMPKDALMVRGWKKERQKLRFGDRSKSWGRYGPKCWNYEKTSHLKRDFRSKSADPGKRSDESIFVESKKCNNEFGDVYLASCSTRSYRNNW